jgi:tetratricopeptide (TPR) repeat protein
LKTRREVNMKMKKMFLLFFILWLSGRGIFPETRADVISKSGRTLILNKGAQDGVEVGMTGLVKTIMKESGNQYDINVGAFTIRRVMAKTCEADITKVAQGMNVAQAQFVVFDKDFTPPPPPLSIDSLLEQGEQAFERGNYKNAKNYFEEALKLDPQNPVAKRFLQDCQKEIEKQEVINRKLESKRRSDNYIEKAIKYVNEGKTDIGIGYYLMAYQAFPDNKEKIVRKLLSLWQGNQSIDAIILKDGGEPGKILLGNMYLKQAELYYIRNDIEDSYEFIEKAQKFLAEGETGGLKEKVRQALKNRKGTLQVSAYPFADVYIDDQFFGEVPPQKSINLQTGKHQLKLVGKGNKTFAETVTIKFHKTTKIHHKFGN